MNEQPQKTLTEILHLRRFNSLYVPDKETPIFTINEKIVGTLENFVVVTGVVKSGKSTFLSAIAASAIYYNDIFGMKINLPKDKQKIAYFDTESSAFDMWRQMERIKKFSRRDYLPDELFDAYNVREDNPNDIIKLINTYLENNVCGVLIIDGLLDLCENMNDEGEAKRVTNWLKRITKQFKILIICVIHLGKKDNNTLGHVGSAADRYCQSCIEVSKDKEQQIFIMQSKFMRSDIDFEPIHIKHFETGFEVVGYEPSIKQNFKNSKK